jgi:hypothetical protein
MCRFIACRVPKFFTGQGTDPNSGLLLIVLAVAFWPFAASRPRDPDHTRPSNTNQPTAPRGRPSDRPR